MKKDALSVSTRGLAQQVARHGINFLSKELMANSLDQDVTAVHMTIESIAHGRGRITITDDDPQGFLDLSHSYTMFAESKKKANPLQRGRFNLGEKLVIAYCMETNGFVEILTTTGGYFFSRQKGRVKLRRKTERGSKVTAEFRASKTALAEMIEYVQTFIPPTGFVTTVNGKELPSRPPLAVFKDFLPTVAANDEGDIFKTTRKATVEIIETVNGEQPMIYEMGIPVVENPTRYHINVQQRVPLNWERNAVTPAYSRKVCALVLNATRDLLTKEEASQPWIAEAMESDDIDAESVKKVLDQKHGKKRVMHDPTNPEASAAAAAQGYAVIYGGSHSSKAHKNIRKHSPVISATKKFRDEGIEFGFGPDNVSIMESAWTDSMKLLASYTKWLHRQVHGSGISVGWLDDHRSYRACYGAGIRFNKQRLGNKWIEMATTSRSGFQDFLNLVIHEFAHYYSDTHYSDEFYRGCTGIGAKVALILADEGLPKWLKAK